MMIAIQKMFYFRLPQSFLRKSPYRKPNFFMGTRHKTICCNSTSNAPDGGRMYPKHVELRIHQ